MANVELSVPIRPEMVFRLGSITKQFTAVAILMLMERGKLGLTDRITKFIPKYPTHGHKITIEHLLTHTSGIKSYTAMPEFWKDAKEDKTPGEHIAFFKDQPMEFKPGERWDYNNSGYFLLGAIIEKISGQTYTAFLKQHVFDRLGMADTHYDLANKIIRGRVQGYEKSDNGIENSAYTTVTISRKATQLLIQFWDNMTPMALTPVSSHEFAMPDSMSRLRFVVNAVGAVQAYQYYDRGFVPEDIAVRIKED